MTSGLFVFLSFFGCALNGGNVCDLPIRGKDLHKGSEKVVEIASAGDQRLATQRKDLIFSTQASGSALNQFERNFALAVYLRYPDL